MTTPINSSNASYLSALQGNGVGSVQSLLTQIRGLMGEVDQQVNNLQGDLRGRMEATSQERHRLDFLRTLSAGMTNISRLGQGSPTATAELMRQNGIDPRNPEDSAMLRQLGITAVVALIPGGTSAIVVTSMGASESEGSVMNTSAVNAIVANHQSALESLTNSMAQDSTRLQALMNRRGEFMSTISQCLNSDHSTASSIIQNIR